MLARELLTRLTLVQRFMLASLLILLVGMIGIGWWIGREIEAGVVHRTAATTALYVDSFIAPRLQQLGRSGSLSSADVAALSTLLQETPLGREIAAFKLWDAEGRVSYSADPSIIGQRFPMEGDLARAWAGEVVSSISDLSGEENVPERARARQLIETYSPVRETGSGQIIAVAEFYQDVAPLQAEITQARVRSWLVVGGATMLMYLLLAEFVRRASDTIERQQVELRRQVARLSDLLQRNDALHGRVQRAARTAAPNERFLRRVSAELHDGPAQELGLALLRLDSAFARCAESGSPAVTAGGRTTSRSGS